MWCGCLGGCAFPFRADLWRQHHYESACVTLGAADKDTELSESDQEAEEEAGGSRRRLQLRYVVGDVTQPAAKYAGRDNAIIGHCVDDAGQWGSGGIFSALLRRSAQPKQVSGQAV